MPASDLKASLFQWMEQFALEGSQSETDPGRVYLAVLNAYDAKVLEHHELLRFILAQMSIAAQAHPFSRSRGAPEVTWFALLHNDLALTEDDQQLHAIDYARFLASSNQELCDFGIAHIKVRNLDFDSAAEICGSISTNLVDATNERALKGLCILSELAKMNPELSELAANAAVGMVLHKSETIQGKSLNLLEQLKSDASQRTWQNLAERLDQLAILPRQQAMTLLTEAGFQAVAITAAIDSSEILDQLKVRCAQVDGDLREEGDVDSILRSIAEQKTNCPAIKLDWKRFPLLDLDDQFVPLQDLDDLVFRAVSLLHGSSDCVEEVLDGIARMCAQRPDDFQLRVGALAKLAESKLAQAGRQGATQSPFSSPNIQICLADLIISWIRGDVYLDPWRNSLADLESTLSESSSTDILRGRLLLLAKRVSSQHQGLLLSTPTHARCWIDPRIAIQRLISLRSKGIEPDFFDFVQMIKRFSPEHYEEALSMCQYISGNYGRVLRALFKRCPDDNLPKKFANALHYGLHSRSMEDRYPAYNIVLWQHATFPDEPINQMLQYRRGLPDGAALELCITGIADGRLDGDALANFKLTMEELAEIAACSPLHMMVVSSALTSILNNADASNSQGAKTKQTQLLEHLYTYLQELGLELDNERLVEKLKTIPGKKGALIASKLLTLKASGSKDVELALLMALENRVERIERWQRWRSSERLQEKSQLPLARVARLRKDALNRLTRPASEPNPILILPAEYTVKSPFRRAAEMLHDAIKIAADFDEHLKKAALADLYEHLACCYIGDSDYEQAQRTLENLLSLLQGREQKDFDKMRWALANLFHLSLMQHNAQSMDEYSNRLFALLQDVPNMHHRLEIALQQAADFGRWQQVQLAEDMYKLVLQLAQLTAETELFNIAQIELLRLYQRTGNHRAAERIRHPESNPDERPLVVDVDGWYDCLRFGRLALDKANYAEAQEFFLSAINKATDKSLTVQREITEAIAGLSGLLTRLRLENESMHFVEAALKASTTAFGEDNLVAIWCLEDLASADLSYNDGRRHYSLMKQAAAMKVKLGLDEI